MTGFRPGTKKYFLASLHAQGLSKTEAFQVLRPKVLNQFSPWIYSANVKGSGRVAKSISEQVVDLQHDISRVWNAIERNGNDVPADAYDADIEIETAEEEIEETPKPKAKGKHKDEEKRFFVSEWKRIRAWIHSVSSQHGTPPIDSLDSNRPIIAAKRMIDAGISARMCLFAMCLHWPEASRQNAGVETVDFLSESEDMGEGHHKLTGYVLKLAAAAKGADFGLMLIGPAGSGKGYLAKQIAKQIKTDSHPDGLPYGQTSMTPGATRGDLLGRPTIGGKFVIQPSDEGWVAIGDGFVPALFVEIYAGGGVFNFDEIDASDPSMLLVVNDALASDQLYNSVNGQIYKKHEDFIAVSTANTFGLGADAKYTGREKLDLASIDRFRMCRVVIDLDEKLAEHLMYS